ncbi:phosphotransferase [Baekduia soli]|uniref:phosphotransferase n=1 Tax=Baekduia soli TaxID=496014 RepID=UPI001651E493|nr:phosphotransferase [Baekduia soli]
MNVVATYLREHRAALALDALGLPEDPPFVLITPRFALSAHVVILILGADGAPVLAAKLPRRPGDDGALAVEASNLRAVAAALGDDGSTPGVVAFDEDLHHPLLLQRALRGTPASTAVVHADRAGVVAKVTAWCDRLAAATAAPPAPETVARVLVRPLCELAARPGVDGLVSDLARRTLPLAERVAAAGVPWVFEHGDLGHPNLLLDDDGRLGVLDFERAEHAGPPGHDVAFFCAYAAVAASRRPPEQAVAEAFHGRQAWAGEVVAGHLARLGVDPGLHGALVAVGCARVVAGALAAGLTPRIGDRDAAGRHLALWDLALATGAAGHTLTDRAVA